MAGFIFKKTSNGTANLGGPYSVVWSSAVAGNTQAGIRVNSTGSIQSREGGTYTNLFTWLLSGSAAAYDVRITGVVGTAPTGTAAGTWVNAGTSPEWLVQDGIVDLSSVNSSFTLEISLAGAASAFDSASVNLSSERV